MIENIVVTVVLIFLTFNTNAQHDTIHLKKNVNSTGKYHINSKEETIINVLVDSRDGNIYKVVQIGEQIWMAENLKYLLNVVGSSAGSETKPYYYVSGYQGTNVSEAKTHINYKTYGVLYNWSAVMNGDASSTTNPSGVQGICPCGWHLPSDAEWTQLTYYLDLSVAGGKLKEAGTTHWDSPNTGATNETGFTALPGNYRNDDGVFVTIGEDCDLWSATEKDVNYAWFRNIHYNDRDVGRNNFNKEIGFSVRCIKN